MAGSARERRAVWCVGKQNVFSNATLSLQRPDFRRHSCAIKPSLPQSASRRLSRPSMLALRSTVAGCTPALLFLAFTGCGRGGHLAEATMAPADDPTAAPRALMSTPSAPSAPTLATAAGSPAPPASASAARRWASIPTRWRRTDVLGTPRRSSKSVRAALKPAGEPDRPRRAGGAGLWSPHRRRTTVGQDVRSTTSRA